MSWQAMRLVVLYGPEDNQLYRLCNTVAEAADSRGEDAVLGLRLLAERTRVSLYRLRKLVAAAVEDEWLVVVHRGEGSSRSVYDLGPRFVDADQRAELSVLPARRRRAGARELSSNGARQLDLRAESRAPARAAERGFRALARESDAQPRTRTVRSDGLSERATLAPRKRRGARSLRDQDPSPVPLHPSPDGSGERIELPAGNDGESCEVSKPDFEAAREVVRSKVRPL